MYKIKLTEVVTTGSPQTLPSWLVLHRNRTYGGFVDAVVRFFLKKKEEVTCHTNTSIAVVSTFSIIDVL
jgi:hypothetical protein